MTRNLAWTHQGRLFPRYFATLLHNPPPSPHSIGPMTRIDRPWHWHIPHSRLVYALNASELISKWLSQRRMVASCGGEGTSLHRLKRFSGKVHDQTVVTLDWCPNGCDAAETVGLTEDSFGGFPPPAPFIRERKGEEEVVREMMKWLPGRWRQTPNKK